MSVFLASRTELDDSTSMEVPDINAEERITKPTTLRSIHAWNCENDSDASANRAAVRELKDFVPPYEEQDLNDRGQGDRFNINYGVATALINEAIGPFLDIFTSPNVLVRLALSSEVDPDLRATYADVMADEWTKMIRNWDVSIPKMLEMIDIFVTDGVGIPWFEDKSTLKWQVGSLEDCKFDAEATAVPSEVELFTISRRMSVTELFQKIEGHETETNYNGWNGPEGKRLIESARPKTIDSDTWNYEEAARIAKSCRIGNMGNLPVIDLVWGMVRELNGKISVYATTKDLPNDGGNKPDVPRHDEAWLYCKRNAYDDANQMFMIFAFSVGNRNRIYTIRGLGYALFEPGQADNVLRCKMMDSARHRASEIYQPESTVDSIEDLQFIDLGHAMIAPKGLKGVPQMNSMRMDENIGYALESNQNVLNRHSSGLAGNSLTENPTARRNELQVTAELEHNNKQQGFAVNLFYQPYDKLIRELVRRAFTEPQSDLAIAQMVEEMKEACVARGVPKETFDMINLKATQATRLMGAGSKGSRLIGFQQMGELYASMDAQGQENFNYDFASEIKGSEAAERYFGTPGQRRGHMDVAIARLENNDLLDGQIIDPTDGENRMVHLEEHIEALVTGIEQVNQGEVDMAEWTMQNIPLYKHCVQTLELTTVHSTQIAKLNSFRQQIQQAGEIIDNGLRHINKMQQEAEEAGTQMGPDGQPVAPQGGGQVDPEAQQKADAAQADNNMKMMKIFSEAKAKIEVMQQMSAAKMAIQHQESTAKIASMDAQTAADIRRKNVLAAATGA